MLIAENVTVNFFGLTVNDRVWGVHFAKYFLHYVGHHHCWR